jgi:hypothetical protein
LKKVTKIAQNTVDLTKRPKLRVAAYCRVSTDSDDQLVSLETQMKHYESFNHSRYLICTTALITILEGLLSEFGDDKKDIRMIRICRFQMDQTKTDKKIINHLVWVSFFNFIKELYDKSAFDESEPDRINRHWILHGRTDKQVGEADCLRLFNAIYSLVTMLKYEDK